MTTSIRSDGLSKRNRGIHTYPTASPLQRVSPWLNGRDLTGEIIGEAHRHGIKAVPMIESHQEITL